MASTPIAVDYSTTAAPSVRRWNPGVRITVAIVLAVLSWTPILVASVLLGR